MKLKIDGNEQEFDESEVIRYAQLGKASDKRFQEASKMRKESEDLISLIKRDPRAVLEDPRIGHNFRQLAEQFLSEELQREMQTPEQRKNFDNEKKLRQFEDERKSQQQEVESQQQAKLQEHYANEYTQTITTALSTSGVPKTPRTVKRMAELMSQSLQHGIDLKPQDLAKIVKEDYINEMKELFGSADDDILLGLVGDETANKIRKADLKRLKGGQIQQQRASSAKPQADKPQKKESPDEFFARLKKGF